MTIAHQASMAEGPAATPKRILLAWYLDFLFYSVFATLVSYSASWAFGTTWVAQLAGFGLVRSAIGFFIETPGMMVLGVRRDGTRDTVTLHHETWLTMLIGTVFILDGAKRAVRWTEYARALPEFGLLPGETGQMVLALAWGAGLITAGCLILRMRPSGLWLGLALTAATVLSVVWSWPLWEQTVVLEVTERRKAQGLPVRPGEIAFMQSFVPGALALANAALVGVLAATRRRFPAA